MVDAAYNVHMDLGPGLLENVHEECLLHELAKKGLHVEPQVCVPIDYDGVRLRGGLRLDILAEKKVVVELETTASNESYANQRKTIKKYRLIHQTPTTCHPCI